MLQICRNEEIFVASFAKKCTSKLFAHNDRKLEMVREHGKLVTNTPNNNTCFFLFFAPRWARRAGIDERSYSAETGAYLMFFVLFLRAGRLCFGKCACIQ